MLDLVITYNFSKDKIPKTYSYPLKRNILDRYLSDAQLNKIPSVNYCFNLKSDRIILRSDYCGESKQGWIAAGFSRIYLWAVPLHKQEEIQLLLINEVLPVLINWLKKAEQEGNVWRAKSHSIAFYHDKDRLLIKKW